MASASAGGGVGTADGATDHVGQLDRNARATRRAGPHAVHVNLGEAGLPVWGSLVGEEALNRVRTTPREG